MKYEYATRHYDHNKEHLVEVLNEYGSYGWRMIAVMMLGENDRQVVMMREVEEDKQPAQTLSDICGSTPPLGTFEPAKTATVTLGTPSSGSGRVMMVCTKCGTELGDKDKILLSFARRIVAQAELMEKRA